MKQHKIIVVGCGGMSGQWLDYVTQRENAEIAGLVDLSRENAERVATERGLDLPIYTDINEALTKLDATIVFDITIPSSHKEVVMAGLKAGCHVFGEKPMAESFADAKEILAVVKETGKRYAVMQNRRYVQEIRSLQEFLQAGEIGAIGSIHADFFLGPHFGGFRDVMDHPLILDMAIHTFDQARFMIGADPVSVYCQEYNPAGSWYKGNASAVCIFEMSNNTLFSYRGSWCAEGLPTSWESAWRITGSKGSVVWANGEDPTCEVIDETSAPAFTREVNKITIPLTWQGREGHAGCLDEMFASIEEDRPAETSSMDNFQSISMVLGAMESASTGKKIYL